MVQLYTRYLAHLRTRILCSRDPSLYPLGSITRDFVTAKNGSLPTKAFEPRSNDRVTVSLMGIANEVLDEMPQRDYKSCNTMIKNYTADAQYEKVLSIFIWMHGIDLRPDSLSFSATIKSLAVLSDVLLGKTLHGFAVKGGYSIAAIVQKALMNMYASFGLLRDSCRVFEDMTQRDSVSWNILLTGFAHSQLHIKAIELFRSMHASRDEEVKPTSITIALVLPICSKMRFLIFGQSIHGFTIKNGLESETLVANALVSMYSKCGCVMDDALTVFSLIAFKDVVSWNSIIAGFSENDFFVDAFRLFQQMVSMGFHPNYATVANVLPICALVENGWCYGKEIHRYVLRFSLENNLSVCNALLTHYSKVGDMKRAESVFRKMHSGDVVTWNTLIAGYTVNGWLLKALDLFHALLSNGISPDSVTLVSVLPVYAQLYDDVQVGRKIHAYVLHHPTLSKETSVGNALVSFYGKCGKLDDALWTFQEISMKDTISWNSIMTVYADNGQREKLSYLLNQMCNEGIQPDSVTLLSVLQSCTPMGMKNVMEVHGYSIRVGLIIKQTVGNAIIDAYGKCGSLDSAVKTFGTLIGKNVVTDNTMISGYLKHGFQEDAEKIFDQMYEKDLTTWNLMLRLYAQNDCTDRALNLFHELQIEGMRPDTVSIMSILVACVRLASVCIVRQCHCYVLRASIQDLHLEGALLDTYSKCGSVKDANNFFRASPQKDLILFTAMVGGYAMHGMAKEALTIFSQMISLDIKPDHVIFTALLSACSHGGLMDEGWRLFRSIDKIHGILPTTEHYTCVVDLLARGGRLKEAYDFIMDMPHEPNANVWGTLLGACKVYGEVEIGKLVADHLFELESDNIGNYVVMSNIYAAGGRWDGVEQLRKLMKTKDLRKPAGCSWIEIERARHLFVASDVSHPQRPLIFNMLRSLNRQMKVPSVQRTLMVMDHEVLMV